MSNQEFKVVYAFDKDIKEFMIKGIFTKDEDAVSCRLAAIADGYVEQSTVVVRQSQSMIANHLIDIHTREIAGNCERMNKLQLVVYLIKIICWNKK